ncbi:MAG: hypothetical protein INF12_14780 [Methylobacterium sp.]|nr:hypothetical protein [Methylobacterium sp.]
MGWRSDCPQCVASKFTCDKHYEKVEIITFPRRLDVIATDAARIETRASRLLQKARELSKKMEGLK